VIVVTIARKPVPTSIARNVLASGTGGLNIDGCRVGVFQNTRFRGASGYSALGALQGYRTRTYPQPEKIVEGEGRWPANLVLQHRTGCRQDGSTILKHGSGGVTGEEPGKALQLFGGLTRPAFRSYGNGDGTETMSAWVCMPDCPVAELDRQSGISVGVRSTGRNGTDNAVATFGLQRKEDTARGHDDAGTASRFFKQVISG